MDYHGDLRPGARSCILLYMDGGPSHIGLWDLKPQASAEIREPYQPIATSVLGLQIGELLPLTAQQMHRAVLVELTRDGEVQRPELGLRPGLTRERLSGLDALVRRMNGDHSRLPRSSSSAHFDVCQRQALDILAAPRVDQAFDLDLEPLAVRERYGQHRHGRSVLLARRLVEAGARFVTVYWGKAMQDWADGRGPQLANNP